MDEILKAEINTLITRRILQFRDILIKTGQIKGVGVPGPPVNPPTSRCIQSGRMLRDGHLEDPSPLHADPIQTN